MTQREPIAQPVAIVGIGLRFPQADSPEAFFTLLEGGVDAVTEVPRGRWDAAALAENAEAPGHTYARWGGFLDDVDGFDVGFFGIAPREAARLDPQQRLMLEVAWEAFEDAGMPVSGLAGRSVGVFVGAATDDHTRNALGATEAIDAHTTTGASLGLVANRISYLFDFTGPSMVVDTACSSSLLAVHLACRSLASGESTVAIAGGVNLMLDPGLTIGLSRLKALSPSGRCKTFDASADGYVRAEGAAFVVLKPLEAALAEGDRIYAVIRGSAVNQDGRSNGLTAPNRHAQESVLRAAYAAGGVPPGRVQYVEAHGTGTLLGDPIELKALGAVVGEGREAGSPCLVGSVKTNIGHAEAAAGVAGLIKTALCLHRRVLVPSLHFETPNPYIPFSSLPVEVVTSVRPWPAPVGSGLAGVSAFGFGGTNVHLAVAEAPVSVPDDEAVEASSQLLALSARNEGALRTLAAAWRDKLGGHGDASVAALCRAAACERDHHARRLSVVGRTPEALCEGLEAYIAGRPQRGVSWGSRPHRRLAMRAFVFCGQGAQWLGMGQSLMQEEPVFRAAVEAIDAVFVPLAGWSIGEALQAPAEVAWADTAIAQPALFAVQVAVSSVLAHWGIRPDLVVGHSAGEVAAAHVAGVLSLEDAVRVILHRGRIMQRATGWGGTVALGLAEGDASRLIAPYAGHLVVSGINGPSSVTIAGDAEALAAVMATCEANGTFARRLPVDYAFHHPNLSALVDDLAGALDGIRPQAGVVPIYSTVSGAIAEGRDFGAHYWGYQLAEPVAFQAAIEAMAAAKAGVFVEIGPHPVLASGIDETLEAMGLAGTMVPTLRREAGGRDALLGAMGALYALGEDPTWDSIWPPGRRAVGLPTYPWQRETFRSPALARSVRLTSWLGNRFDPAGMRTSYWQRPLSLEAWPTLRDHVVGGAVVVPGAAYMDWALLAGREVFRDVALELGDVAFERALVVAEDETLDLQFALAREGDGGHFEVFSRREGSSDWTRHASARILPRTAREGEAIADQEGTSSSGADHYALMRRRGLAYGAAFQGVVSVSARAGIAVAEVVLPAVLETETGRHAFAPAFLDAAMQLVGPAVPGAEDGTYMPVGVGRFRLWTAPGDRLVSRATVRPGNAPGTFEADVTMSRPDGTRVADVLGLVVQRIDGATAQPDDWCYGIRWDEVALEAAPDVSALSGRWAVSGDGDVAEALRAALTRRGADVLADAAGVEVAGAVIVVPTDSESAHDSALAALRALRGAMAGRAAVWLVTQGAMQLGDEAIAPAQAAAWGLGRVAETEYEGGALHLVDLPLGADARDWELLARAIAPDVSETQVAVRSERLYAPRLASRAMPAAGDYVASAAGMHLITGGLGGIGLGLAGWLISRGARHLTLVGRSAPSTAAKTQLAAWRDSGVDVRVHAVDVSRGDAVEALLNRLGTEGPSLVGVYHAAGALVTGALVDTDEDALATAMAAKAEGARHLDRLTRGMALEAFVLFGSAAATLGSHGQGAYAAANAYLGAIAHHRRAEGLVATHVAWGPWAGVGMAAGAEESAHLRKVGLAALPAEAAYRLLGRAIATGTTDVAVIDFLPEAYQAAWPRAAASPFLAGLFVGLGEESLADDALVARWMTLAESERLAAVEAYLADAVGAALGRSADALDRACPLNALGMDSLMGMQVRNRVARDLGVAIAMMDLLKGPTIEELARLVMPKLAERELVAVVPRALTLEMVLAEPERLLAEMAGMSEAELDRWIGALEGA